MFQHHGWVCGVCRPHWVWYRTRLSQLGFSGVPLDTHSWQPLRLGVNKLKAYIWPLTPFPYLKHFFPSLSTFSHSTFSHANYKPPSPHSSLPLPTLSHSFLPLPVSPSLFPPSFLSSRLARRCSSLVLPTMSQTCFPPLSTTPVSTAGRCGGWMQGLDGWRQSFGGKVRFSVATMPTHG